MKSPSTESEINHQPELSNRELAARDIARLTKTWIAAQAEWGNDSYRTQSARDQTDALMSELQNKPYGYEAISEGLARAYDLTPKLEPVTKPAEKPTVIP